MRNASDHISEQPPGGRSPPPRGFPPAPAFRSACEDAIRDQVADGRACSREDVARRLCVNERTLNRRLAAAGTSFEQIRDAVRASLAMRYLASPDLSLAQVSDRLGFSEPSALSRWCRRRFGRPPGRLRQEIRPRA